MRPGTDSWTVGANHLSSRDIELNIIIFEDIYEIVPILVQLSYWINEAPSPNRCKGALPFCTTRSSRAFCRSIFNSSSCSRVSCFSQAENLVQRPSRRRYGTGGGRAPYYLYIYNEYSTMISAWLRRVENTCHPLRVYRTTTIYYLHLIYAATLGGQPPQPTAALRGARPRVRQRALVISQRSR